MIENIFGVGIIIAVVLAFTVKIFDLFYTLKINSINKKLIENKYIESNNFLSRTMKFWFLPFEFLSWNKLEKKLVSGLSSEAIGSISTESAGLRKIHSIYVKVLYVFYAVFLLLILAGIIFFNLK